MKLQQKNTYAHALNILKGNIIERGVSLSILCTSRKRYSKLERISLITRLKEKQVSTVSYQNDDGSLGLKNIGHLMRVREYP